MYAPPPPWSSSQAVCWTGVQFFTPPCCVGVRAQVESKIDSIKEKFAKQMDRLKQKTASVSGERAECDSEAAALAKVCLSD
jgi:hypothetical protein